MPSIRVTLSNATLRYAMAESERLNMTLSEFARACMVNQLRAPIEAQVPLAVRQDHESALKAQELGRRGILRDAEAPGADHHLHHHRMVAWLLDCGFTMEQASAEAQRDIPLDDEEAMDEPPPELMQRITDLLQKQTQSAK